MIKKKHKVANLKLVLILIPVCQHFQKFYKFMYTYIEINTYIRIIKFKND